jgi:hypothetical protein
LNGGKWKREVSCHLGRLCLRKVKSSWRQGLWILR